MNETKENQLLAYQHYGDNYQCTFSVYKIAGGRIMAEDSTQAIDQTFEADDIDGLREKVAEDETLYGREVIHQIIDEAEKELGNGG